MREAMGPLGRADAAAWALALTWTAPVDLGAAWHAGAAVAIPHPVTSFEHDGVLYLRTGQPPGPSSLYCLSAGTLTRVDDGSRIAADRRHWVLPCGGGTVAVHEPWQKPPLIVVCAEDQRGIYVQKG